MGWDEEKEKDEKPEDGGERGEMQKAQGSQEEAGHREAGHREAETQEQGGIKPEAEEVGRVIPGPTFRSLFLWHCVECHMGRC